MAQTNPRVVFFDMRNTLGVVDRRGHLVAFKPSTIDLLTTVRDKMGARIGVITNVPPGVDARRMLEEAGLLEFLDPNGLVSTEDADIKAAQASKPGRKIFEMAAARMGTPISDCIYVGENLIEQLGAWCAGMAMGHKEFPPAGDFARDPLVRGPQDAKSSGRLAEALLEEEHLVGKRIVMAAVKMRERLATGEDPTQPDSPLMRAMSRLVWLTKYFIDPFHHRKEEEVLIPFGIMHGIAPSEIAWVALEHEQGRAYFRALEVALARMQNGDWQARGEFSAVLGAFVDLYKAHGKKEDDELFKRIGDLLTDADDALIVGLMARVGPPDVTLYHDMISAMEKDLGIDP